MEEGRVVPTEDLPRLSSVDLTIFDDQSFQFFRSWYKGGRVCERQQFWNSPARALMLEIAERDVEDDQNLMLTVTQGDHKNPDVAEDISINDSMTDATGIPGQFKLLLSDIPYNVEQGRKASEAQMLRRAELLQKRIQYVENRKVETARLLELHKHCEKESLRFGDLQTKRNALSKLDIDALMASKKLAELCRQADVEMFRLPGQFMQRVCKADIFLNTPKSYLTPDNPPPLIKGNAEDGGKFPVKFWLNCSDLEKELECRIACMLDSITELAVVNSIYVPSIEDADMDDTLVPIRSNKWKRFVEWYAGPERTTAEPTGFSKARLAFSDWERSAAGSNFFVHLRVRGKAPTVLEESPPLIVGEDEDSASVGSIGGMSIASVKSEMTRDSSTVMTGVPSVQETAMSREAQLAQIKKEQEIVVDQYTDTVNTQSGADLRVDLFTEYVAALNSSRYASVMRCMWPSAPPRQSIQYMFPRMGLLTPIPEPHTLHMKLYASRKIDGYTIKDIMKFFSVEELNDDDTKMQKAEEKGKKFEEYIIWLSKEKDRVAAGRAMMLEEDVTGHKFRILQDNLARKIADPKGNPNFNAYSMAGSLPGAYDGFMEGTAVYVDGDGCLNEDEIFDIKDDMIRRAREGFLALQEKKRIALEDQKKAEELERIRAEKREREKRIQEGVMRRQNIRAKLALIKEERELKTMIAHRDRLLADEEEKKKLAHELALRMAADLKKAERDNELRERHMMAAEEAFQRAEEFLRRNRHGMEREDMLSHTREDLDAYAEEQLSERMKDLKELYTSLEPFHFKKRRAETGWLDTDEREPFYARVEVPVSPTGSRFPPEKKKRQPAATIQEDDGRILYPATMSTKFHSNGVNRFIRFPDVTVKETRFNSPPRFQSPIIENKIATILSKTAPVGEMYIANGLSNRSDQVFSPLQAAENAPSRAHPSSRTEVMFKLDDFLPAIAHHMQSPLTASELEHRGFDNKNGDAEGIQLPSIIVPRNHSKAIKGNTLKTSKSDFGQKSIELSGKDDLKYVISKDITGLQNRKKLLRASLSGLDWKKEFVKAPRARLKHHIHQSSERLVDRVKKERDDVGAYLSEASTHEVLEDKYYAMACEPGIRYVDSVNANNKTIVHDFRMSLFQNLAVIEELAYCEANNIAVSLPIDPRNDSPQNPPIDDESVNSAAAKIKLENEIKNAANLSRGSAKSRQLDTANSDVNNRPLTTKTTLTRATTAATLPEELEFPVDKIDYRQINVPPPFFRKTFGVLGSRKEIGLDPKILAKSESVVSLKK